MKKKNVLPDGYKCKNICGNYVIYRADGSATGIWSWTRHQAISKFLEKGDIYLKTDSQKQL